MDKLRIDKWLWAARFYKTRALAVEEIDKGRVRVNDVEAKPSREVKAGDTVFIPPGVPHSATNIGDGDARLLEIYAPLDVDFIEVDGEGLPMTPGGD